MKKRSSFTFRIALPFVLLLLLTMAGLSLYLSSFVRSAYLELLQTNLQSETRLVADQLATDFASNGPIDAISSRASQYAEMLNARVTIIDPSGLVLGESHTQAGSMENHLDRPEVQRALQSTVSTEIRYSETLGTDMLYAAAPIVSDGELYGVARLAVSLQAIQRSQNEMLRTVLFATAIAALLSILIALLIAAYTLRPIRRLTQTAQRIAEGDLQEVPPTTRGDEIGLLQNAFQYMAHRMKTQLTELETERGQREAVLEHMTDGILIVDANGFVQLANPAALRIFQAQFDGKHETSLIEIVRHHQFVELWRRCVQTSEQQTSTIEITPDRLFVQGIASTLDSSLPGMTLMVFQDLTRVRRLETVRRDFVSNVSHELRTPLASLKALAETLHEGALEDPPAARRFLQRMEIEIDNLTQMVQELLELTRIESNRFPMQRVRIEPCEVTDPAIERMQLQAERAGLSLRAECETPLPPIHADAARIQQVLVNLIHNAIKFTPPGGEIIISTRRDVNDVDFVVFSVRDTGAGIPPEVLPRIFERFYKVDRARSGGGTGLGLSIARHIVEAHGGRIWAESDLGKGSIFFFSIPVG